MDKNTKNFNHEWTQIDTNEYNKKIFINKKINNRYN